MARISRTGTTDSTGVASTTVTGSGGGRLKFISRNGNLWSNSYEIDDYLFYDDGITSTSNGFIFNTTDIQLNVDTVGKTGTTVSNVSSTTGRTYWANKKGTPSTVDLDWDYPVAIECDILNGSSVVAFQFGRQADSQIVSRTLNQLGLTNGGHLKFTFDGTNARYFVNNSNTPLFTVPLQISDLSVIRFYCPASTNFKYKNFMIYPIFSAPKHYTPIALSSSASIIQTGETATLTAELTNVLGEKLAQKSVNFIEKFEPTNLYVNDGTDTSTLTISSGASVTVEDGALKITTSTTGEKYAYYNYELDNSDNFLFECEVAKLGTNQSVAMVIGSGINWFAYSNSTNKWEGRIIDAFSNIDTGTLAIGDKIKIKQLNGVITLYHNDTVIYSKTANLGSNFKIGHYTNNGRVQYIKNIKLTDWAEDTLIGTGTTNTNGIATCNNSITGTGKGKRQFIASNSSILSETYTILDKP